MDTEPDERWQGTGLRLVKTAAEEGSPKGDQKKDFVSHQGRNVPSTVVVPSLNYKMVFVPPGTFWMGMDDDHQYQSSQSMPVHKVSLSKGFYVGVTEVTVGDWSRFIYETGYRTEAENRGCCIPITDNRGIVATGPVKGYRWDRPGFDQSQSHLVTCVSWNDVQAFMRWLNGKERSNKYRLPTEAEWEYACQAGSTDDYFFGNERTRLDGYAWYYANSGGRTHPVAQKQPNAWGLHDVLGNVAEFCEDWFDQYREGEFFDPHGPSSGSGRIVRGGYYRQDSNELFSASRSFEWSNPDFGYDYVGFRLVRDE